MTGGQVLRSDNALTCCMASTTLAEALGKRLCVHSEPTVSADIIARVREVDMEV